MRRPVGAHQQTMDKVPKKYKRTKSLKISHHPDIWWFLFQKKSCQGYADFSLYIGTEVIQTPLLKSSKTRLRAPTSQNVIMPSLPQHVTLN